MRENSKVVEGDEAGEARVDMKHGIFIQWRIN